LRESPRSVDGIQRAIESEFERETRVEVATIVDSSHLLVLLENPILDTLSASLVNDKARALAKKIMISYAAASTLESVTVRFVKFLSTRGGSYHRAKGRSFAVTELR